MTRIIAGAWGGRRLVTPKGADTRPTSDRVREAMFSSLEAELGGFDGLRVLDLYAGSGALGLEALSRGAAHVDLVESGRLAGQVIARNLGDLAVRSARLHRTTAERFVGACRDTYDLVLMDPPYRDDPAAILVSLVRSLAPGAVVVVERSSRSADLVWPDGVVGVRDKAYGDTRLWYGQRRAEAQ
jgi:16S rRNA (guanine966-N2)-methyltransferase